VKGRPFLFWSSAAALLICVAWQYHRDAPLRAGVAYHHVASVRELARGEFPPRHNLVPGHLPQPHYGPYLVALGFGARVTGASPVLMLYVAGLCLMGAYLLAFRALARRLVGEAAADWSALAATLLWGPWPGPVVEWATWGWPGTTSPADAFNFFYPQHAAVLLLLLVLVLLLPQPRARGAAEDSTAASTILPGRFLAALGVSALLVATHPLTGIALAAAVVALAASEALVPGVRRRARLLALTTLPAGALALACLWPYYPMLELLESFRLPPPVPLTDAHVPTPTEVEPQPSIDPPARIRIPAEPAPSPVPLGTPPESGVSWSATLGPALAGLGWAVVLAFRKQPFLLLWSLALLLIAAMPQMALHDRILLFAAAPLQIAACGLLEHAFSRRARVWRGLAVALLVAGGVSALQRAAWVLDQELTDLQWMEHSLPEDAVVLADPRTSNTVAGLTGRKIVAPEGPDMLLVIRGGWQRVVDAHIFFRQHTPPSERDAILRRWGATHVLVDTLGPGSPPLPYPVAGAAGGYVLYDVRGAR
jgi:hypothetical protein